MPHLPGETWEALEPVLLELHSQADPKELQTCFLRRLEELIPHRRSFFDLCSPQAGRLVFFEPVSRNMSEEELAAYYQEYQYSDYVAWSFASDEPTVYRDSDMVSPAARESAAIYKQWMQPMGIYWSMGSTVMGADHLLGSVTLFRSREDGDFTDQEMEMLRVLNRHLSAHFSLLWPQGAHLAGKPGLSDLAARYGLSARENEIAGLIATGLTNQEIGAALFISENTIKKHVNSLYRKLGITGRTQLLRLVYEQVAVIVPARAE